MADEPMLCFDGDGAGRRAAYRAVDLALPQLQPGKSLRFAILPAGAGPRRPRPLRRPRGGRRGARGARPLADMLWLRETEAGNFDTPERRAALEARIGAVDRSIGDESVRKYYRQDLGGRRARPVRPGRTAPRGPRDCQGGRAAARAARPRSGRSGSRSGRRPLADGARRRSRSAPRINASPIVRGFRSALPPREALILLAVINHPWLLESHAEELAELEFRHPDADRLRARDPRCRAGHAHAPVEPSAAARGDFGGAGSDPCWPASSRDHPRLRLAGAAGRRPRGCRKTGGPTSITLHRKQRTLNKELKEAERALGTEPSEENLHWLRDVQERLSALEGSRGVDRGFRRLVGPAGADASERCRPTELHRVAGVAAGRAEDRIELGQ